MERIAKQVEAGGRLPQLADYGRARREFTWAAGRRLLDGLPDGGLNMAYEAVDRHVRSGRGGATALQCVDRDSRQRSVSYAELQAMADGFAHALARLQVQPGERVFALLGRVPELYAAALGTLKYGAVFSALFAAFGPEPIRTRLTIGEARVLVTTRSLYQRKIVPIRDGLPSLWRFWVIDAGELAGRDGVEDWDAALAASPQDGFLPRTKAGDPALLHFTSGTTGEPKALVHVHEAAVAHAVTGRWALDLTADDVFWCTADPGWVTGISYGILAPLLLGCTVLLDEREFDPQRWLLTLQDLRVSVWYTAPTAIRVMMRLGEDWTRRYDLTALRHMASVGEPLNAGAVEWGLRALGRPFHDTYWQTETGAIVVANLPAVDIKPGAMGVVLPGFDAAVTAPGRPGEPLPVGEVGELALRAGWPSMFRACLNRPDYYDRVMRDGWYMTGDLVRRDADGYLWFVGRADDMIKTSGHFVGPFEVEAALLAHPAVAEAGVVGVPDPVAGETVTAFVTLARGVTASESLNRELLGFARQRLGAAVAPKALYFRSRMPHTRSGKILRRRLRELALHGQGGKR